MKCPLSGCPNDGEHEITVRIPEVFPALFEKGIAQFVDTKLLVCTPHYELLSKGLVSAISIGSDDTVTDTL